MFAGWLELASVEIINNARMSTYARALGLPVNDCDMCQCLGHAMGELGMQFENPVADNAPWLDPTVKESANFAGFMGLSIDGLGSSTALRTATALVGDGALIGPVKRGAREIHVTALAGACNAQAISYGLSWLSSTLRGAGCGPGCAGDPLCALAWCPGEYATYDEWSQAMRHLYKVGLTSPPVITERFNIEPGACDPAWLVKVEFTLTAGLPFMFREPLRERAKKFASASGIVDPPKPCPSELNNCEEGDCVPQWPVLPDVPDVSDPCACPAVPATAWRTVVEVTPKGGTWLEAVPLIEVQTGSDELECLRVRFWSSPGARDCAHTIADVNSPADEHRECNYCGQLAVPWLPAGATFFVDGRTQTVSIQCDREHSMVGPDAVAPAISGGPGQDRYLWPVFDCRGAICFEFLAKSVASDAHVTASLVIREDAS